MQRLRAERMAQLQTQTNAQKEMVRQGKGVVQDCPIENLAAIIKASQLMVVHLADPKHPMAPYAVSHLQRLAGVHLGTDFVQCDVTAEEQKRMCHSEWRVVRFPTVLCFKDGSLGATICLEELPDLDAGDFALKRFLAQAGVLVSATGARHEDSDDGEEEIDLPPCGVPGCKTMWAHEHVGKGRGTGGVERFGDEADPSKGYGQGIYSESARMDLRDRLSSDDDAY